MSSIPPKVLELIREDEKILAVHEIFCIFSKEGLLSSRLFHVPGTLVITNGNIYIYAQSPTLDRSILRDIPLQKITIAKFVALKKVNFLTKMLKSKEIDRLTEEFKLPEKVLKGGILKIATTWESVLFHPSKFSLDIKDSIKTSREIIFTMKKTLESFYPEPLSVVEEQDEIKYYLSLKVPHRKISKQEIIIKSKNKRHKDTLENIKKCLKDLKELYEEGIITKEEYEQKKEELLLKLLNDTIK